MTRGQVIVTADDFGLDPEVNEAIVNGVAAGFVSNVSLLVNFPSFGEACELARQHGFADRLGLHFNLTEGRPLTDAMRRSSASASMARSSRSTSSAAAAGCRPTNARRWCARQRRRSPPPAPPAFG